jgi:predicted lactoylglutathione lyase
VYITDQNHGYEDLDGHTWELVHMTGAPVEHLNQ